MVVVEGESMSSLLIVSLVINIEDDRLLVDLPSRIRLDQLVGVLAPNGKVYFVPNNTNRIGELDPATHT